MSRRRSKAKAIRPSGLKLTNHHILAKVRGGKRRGNLVRLPRRHHDAYHTLFDVMTLLEALEFIDYLASLTKRPNKRQIVDERIKIMCGDLRILPREIHLNESGKIPGILPGNLKTAWKILFKGLTAGQAKLLLRIIIVPNKRWNDSDLRKIRAEMAEIDPKIYQNPA